MIRKNNKGNIAGFIAEEWPLLILTTVYFSGEFSFIWPYLTLAVIPILILKNRFGCYLDSTSIWIIVFSVSYAIISDIYGFNATAKGNLVLFSVFPLMFYVTGRYLTDTWYNQKYLLFLMLIVSIAISVVLGIISDIAQNGFQNVARAVVVNGTISTATSYGVRISLCITSVGMIFAIARNREERIYQYLMVILGLIGLVCTIHLVNRTGIIVAVASCLTLFLANVRKFRFRQIAVYVILFCLAGYEVYPLMNESKVQESYKNREAEEPGGSVTFGGRTLRWADGVEKIYTQPMGGGVFKSGRRYYAHNFWLDVSEVAGIIPFIALTGCTIINTRKNLLIIRNRRTPSFLSSWLLSLNIGFFLTCFVEPIMEGVPAYAFLYFFFWGMTSIIYERIQDLRTL